MLKAIFLSALIVTIGSFSAAQAQTKTAARTDSAIPYASPAAALADLRAKDGVVFSKQSDWLIAKDTDGAIWSFTPPDHPAHPSVGRRRIVEDNGRFYVETRLICLAQKPACEKLHQDYIELDRRMMEAMRARKA